jgi:hypothetical protein
VSKSSVIREYGSFPTTLAILLAEKNGKGQKEKNGGKRSRRKK